MGGRYTKNATVRNMKRKEELVMAEKVELEGAKLENDKAVAMRRDGPRTHASRTLVDPSDIMLAVDEFRPLSLSILIFLFEDDLCCG